MDSMLESFDRRFAEVHRRSLAVLGLIPQDDLFRKPRDAGHTMTMFSVGEYLLRSAAAVEQTCGGLTTRLWDDPFEWTLPEKLVMKENVLTYFDEVEQTRTSAFRFFTSDGDLTKQLPAPERIRSIFDLLLETVGRSEHYQGRAFAVFQMLSDAKILRL